MKILEVFKKILSLIAVLVMNKGRRNNDLTSVFLPYEIGPFNVSPPVGHGMVGLKNQDISIAVLKATPRRQCYRNYFPMFLKLH